MIKFKKDSKINGRLKSISKEIVVPTLAGKRLYLRTPKLDDYSAWQAVRERNKEFLTPFEPQWADDALSEAFFKRRLGRQHQEMIAHRGAFFLIFSKDRDDIIGGLNLNNIQYGAARCCSFGYWLDEEKQGQGYMYEAVALAIDYAFNILKLNRINAACLPDNHRSVNMLLRHGFEEEGFAKKYLQINGKWQDHRLFGLVA